jgi:hypothetical protein
MNDLQKSYESFVVWENGVPRVELRQMLEKENLMDLPLAALSLPYLRTPKEVFLERDAEFEGLTNAEVMNIRLARKAARGDTWATKDIQDRVLGKPKQQIEKHTISETYDQFLERKEQLADDYIKEMEEANAEVTIEG